MSASTFGAGALRRFIGWINPFDRQRHDAAALPPLAELEQVGKCRNLAIGLDRAPIVPLT
eukprot:973700-Pleurochrysis_carterae.AAC.1